MPLGSTSTIFGYAFNSNAGAVRTPSDPNSGFQGHTNYGRFSINLAQAASSNYNTYLNRLLGTGSGVTTIPGPTTTVPPITTTTSTTTTSAPGPTQTLVS